MKKNSGEEANTGQPAVQRTGKVEQDPSDINRRHLEMDKYLAAQSEGSEVR